MWDAVYSDAALETLRRLSPDQREEFRAVIDYILRDPFPDGRLIIDLPRPPAILRAYNDGRWNVVYYIQNERMIRVYSIQRWQVPGQ